MTDLTLRAPNSDAVYRALTSQPFAFVLGPIDILDGDGQPITDPDLWRQTGRLNANVDYVYFGPGTVEVTPAVFDENGDETTPAVNDPDCWIIMRLIGDAAIADFRPNADNEPDKWKKSNITDAMKTRGNSEDAGHAKAASWTATLAQLGSNGPGAGQKVEILRGSDLAANQGEAVKQAIGRDFPTQMTIRQNPTR